MDWDVLKYGPSGLAALTSAWCAGLLTIEIKRTGEAGILSKDHQDVHAVFDRDLGDVLCL